MIDVKTIKSTDQEEIKQLRKKDNSIHLQCYISTQIPYFNNYKLFVTNYSIY